MTESYKNTVQNTGVLARVSWWVVVCHDVSLGGRDSWRELC